MFKLKKIDKDASYILIFSNHKGSGIDIIFEYTTISHGKKTIKFYKNKNFSKLIL